MDIKNGPIQEEARSIFHWMHHCFKEVTFLYEAD